MKCMIGFLLVVTASAGNWAGRASPAQARRASCQTGSGQESSNNFWSCRASPKCKNRARPGPKPRRAFVESCQPKPDRIFDHIK
jgi:hypothetical protein